MEFVKSEGSSPELLVRLNPVRLSLNSLSFLSDIVTADGRYLEAFATEQGCGGVKSTYDFPPERPTPDDWKQWLLFWAARTETNFKLIRPLGDWEHPTHRDWEWFLDDADHLQLQCREEQGVRHYGPTTMLRTTKSCTVSTQTWRDPTATEVSGQPILVILRPDGTVRPRDAGPSLAEGPTRSDDFWVFLESWGGTWMWDGID